MKKLLSFFVFAIVFFMPQMLCAQDSVAVTFAVNDAAMGTTNPAPGTYTYYDGDEYSVTAIPNDGYQLMGWTVTLVENGEVATYPTNGTNGTLTDHVDIDDGYNAYTITAVFGPANISPDSLTLIIGVNNPDAGTVIPAPGTYYYVIGDQYSVEATANEGYHHVGWHVTIVHPVYGIIQDEVINMPNVNISGVVEDELMLGYVHTIIALFESNEGIEDAEAMDFNVYGSEGCLVIGGAEGREVYIFDINGRMLHHIRSAQATESYAVRTTGVFLVNVAGVKTKRVVVVR